MMKKFLSSEEATTKGTFEISAEDAARICSGLELSAAYDKTTIYYELATWLKELDKK